MQNPITSEQIDFAITTENAKLSQIQKFVDGIKGKGAAWCTSEPFFMPIVQ